MIPELVIIVSIDKAITYKQTTKKARINMLTTKNVRPYKLATEKATTPL
jgi:hypothetical protein